MEFDMNRTDQGTGEGSCRLTFTLPVTPRAQMRPRFARTGRAYKAKAQVMNEETILSLMAQHQPAEPFTGPVLLGVRCFMPIPKSKPKRFKAAALAGEVRPTTKPDLDNLIKNVADCLSSLRFWEDDRQVVGFLAGTGKFYDDGQGARWEVEIRRV